jgi:SAM-dependent methyltransferase
MTYDKSYFDIYEDSHPRLLRNLYRLLLRFSGNKTTRIVSTGCGPAIVEGFIKEQDKVKQQFAIIGLDINVEALSYYTEGILPVAACDSQCLAVKSKCVDILFSFDNFEHLCNPEQFLQEVKRVLKKDGILVLKLPNFGHLYFRLKRLVKGSLGTPLQLKKGHVGFWTYSEVKKYLLAHDFKILHQDVFTYFPLLLQPLALLWRNLFSVSTIIVARPDTKQSPK